MTVYIWGDIATSPIGPGDGKEGKITAPKFCLGASCITVWPSGGGGTGDITAVNVGAGLTGGGASGDVTISFDSTYGDGRYVKKAGDTMTGLLTLSGDPTTALQAVTKQYADSIGTGKVSKAGDTMTGALILNANPSNALGAATKQYVDNLNATRVDKAGDTMTGYLTLVGNPTLAMQAATKQYVDNSVAAAGGGDITGVTAGTGLQGGGLSGDVTLNLGPTYVDGSAYDGRFVNTGGDTMTGMLTLVGNPTLAMQAATKQYVDNSVAAAGGGDITGVTAGTGLTGGGMSGDVTVSFDPTYGDGRYVKKVGDTMTGALTINIGTGVDGLMIKNSSVGKIWDFYPVTNGSNTDLRLYETNTGGNADRVAFQAGGNVGIGTTNPSAKLSLGTGTGKKLLIYDDSSTIFSGLGQDNSAQNGTDLFAWNGGFLTFGKMGTNGTTYTEWMRINNSGNVGIGTGNPSSKLTVAGMIETTANGYKFPDGTIQTTAAVSGGGGDITGVTAGTGLSGGGLSGDVTLNLNTTYTDGRYIQKAGDTMTGWLNLFNSSGNGLQINPGGLGVGINVNNAITGGSFTGVNYGVIAQSTNSATGKAIQALGGAVAGEFVGGDYGVKASGNLMGGSFTDLDSGASAYIAYNNWGMYTPHDVYMGGNVGIGTAGPTEKLEVNSGHLKVTGGNIYISGTSNSNSFKGNSWISNAVSTGLGLFGATDAGFYVGSGGTLQFVSPVGGAAADTVTFLAGGNVGIGTTAPSSKLDVNGDVNVRGDINAANNILASCVYTAYVLDGALIQCPAANPIMTGIQRSGTTMRGYCCKL